MGKLTDEQKIDIVSKYNSGISTKILSLDYNVSSVSIRSILKKEECN